MAIFFLSLDDVLYIHQNQIALYGGDPGVRDMGLLESAIAQPPAAFGGEFLHKDLFEMAAAYMFHIVSNHAFIDGNKRTGLVSALAFLDINEVEVKTDEQRLFDTTMGVAQGHIGKVELVRFFREIAI